MKIQHELDTEKLKQKQWQIAMEQIKEAKEQAEVEHAKYLEQIKEMAVTTQEESASQAAAWFQAQVKELHRPKDTTSEHPNDKEKEEKEADILELKRQQEAISNRLPELSAHNPPAEEPLEAIRRAMAPTKSHTTSQDMLME